MITIDSAYVPLVYAVFFLSMAVLGWWMIRRMIGFRSRLDHAFAAAEERPPVLHSLPVRQWSELRLGSFVRSWRNGVYHSRMALPDRDRPSFWFDAGIRYPIGRLPKGCLQLETPEHRLRLNLTYREGEEGAEIYLDDRLLGYVRLEVQHLPSFLADVALLDEARHPLGRWQCTPLPGEERDTRQSLYGPVVVEGRRIAEMQVFPPRRWRKGRFQSFLDRVHLGVAPNPPLYGAGASLIRHLAPDLTSRESSWLLALLALQLHKLTFRPAGQRR